MGQGVGREGTRLPRHGCGSRAAAKAPVWRRRRRHGVDHTTAPLASPQTPCASPKCSKPREGRAGRQREADTDRLSHTIQLLAVGYPFASRRRIHTDRRAQAPRWACPRRRIQRRHMQPSRAPTSKATRLTGGATQNTEVNPSKLSTLSKLSTRNEGQSPQGPRGPKVPA